jgi:hypothetical protein
MTMETNHGGPVIETLSPQLGRHFRLPGEA